MSKNTDLGSLVNYIKGQVTGRLNAPAYTSATAFTGTIAGYLGFDTSGNILTSAGFGIGGSGTTNYIPKFTASGTIGNSPLFDDGTLITSTSSIYVNKANPFVRFKGSTLDGYIINSNDKLYIADYNTATKNIILDLATGAATFSNSISALSLDVISSSGVGISTASGLARFITAGTSVAISIGQSNVTRRMDLLTYAIVTYGEELDLYTNGSFPILLGTNNTERMRIGSAGGVAINTTTTGYTLNAVRSESTQFNAVYKGSGSLIQIMARFINDTSSNRGIAIGYQQDPWGSGGGIFGTAESNLQLGVKDGVFYRSKIVISKDDILLDIPTSSAGLSNGAIWNDGGTVKITT
jgi:hypothetical protein